LRARAALAALSALIGLTAAPAQAAWVSRAVDGIMGTRIYVELWAEEEDRARGEQAIDAVMDEMRHIDETMSVYKPTSEVSPRSSPSRSALSCSAC
jgi:thiamine biosynthesis lipoprotein ApbE